MTSDPHHQDSSAARTLSQISVAAYVAALDIASEVELAAVLQRLVDLSRDVVPSKYAALGLADETGRITEFITSGISTFERERIGPIPQGHGMLGTLIRDKVPMIVPSIADDPRSFGFPAHHPPMRSLLGVPILRGERVLGNLYLTERLEGRTYNQEDLDAVQILAAHAAAAIERADLYAAVESTRRRAEEQRDHLRVILDSMPSGVIIRRAPRGEVEFVNAMALEMIHHEGSLDAFPGPEEIFHRADGVVMTRDHSPVIRALRGEVVRDRQLTLVRRDGQMKPVLVQAAPLRNSSGEVERAVMVFQDISRMRQAEQLKDDFLSLVSHEFRTPLTAIHGGARLLSQKGDTLDQETRQMLLADIVAESGTLDQMLTNMLTLTSIQAGRLEPATEPIHVPALVQRVVTLISGQLRQHRFEVQPKAGVPSAEGDPDLLTQVLRNLYENAAKYSPQGTTITTSVTFDDDQVSIHVMDEGSGIAAGHLGTVFERFRRPGADPTVRGMGLGLYLSRHLIESQKGRIWVTSPGPGEGATFSVSLPISQGWPTD